MRVLIPLLLALGVASPAYAIRVAVDFSDPDNPQMKTLSGYCDLNGDQCDQTRNLPWVVDFGDGPTSNMVVYGNGTIDFVGDKLASPQFEQFQYESLGYLVAGRNDSELFYLGEAVYEQAARVKLDGDAVVVTWFTCFTPKNCFNTPYSARLEQAMNNGVSELLVTLDYTALPSNFFSFSDKLGVAYFIGNTGGFKGFADIDPNPGQVIFHIPATFTDAVPEPATWALMIMGFGGVGTLLRRRRLTPAA
jgi:hypothetical protein